MAYYRCRKKSGGSPTPTETRIIPSMTSDTLPSGVCSGYKMGSGESAYYAFRDENGSQPPTGKYVTLTEKGAYVQYYFPQQVTLRQIAFRMNNIVYTQSGEYEDYIDCSYVIKTSSDGITWRNMARYTGSYIINDWLIEDVVCNYLRIELFSETPNAKVWDIKAYGAVGNVQLPIPAIQYYVPPYPFSADNNTPNAGYSEFISGGDDIFHGGYVLERYAGPRRLLRNHNFADYVFWYEDLILPDTAYPCSATNVSLPLHINNIIQSNWEIKLKFTKTTSWGVTPYCDFINLGTPSSDKVFYIYLNDNDLYFCSDWTEGYDNQIDISNLGDWCDLTFTKENNVVTITNYDSSTHTTTTLATINWNTEKLEDNDVLSNILYLIEGREPGEDFGFIHHFGFRFLDN